MNKNLLFKLKNYLSSLFKRFLKVIDIFLIYQIIIFLITPTFKYFILVLIFGFIFYRHYYKN